MISKMFILYYHSIKEAYIAKIKRTKTKIIKQSIFQLQIFLISRVINRRG